jgi:hypothetical protein
VEGAEANKVGAALREADAFADEVSEGHGALEGLQLGLRNSGHRRLPPETCQAEIIDLLRKLLLAPVFIFCIDSPV